MLIDYAIFGEQNNGHGLLAASGNMEFAATLSVLTDRPGDPPVGAAWGPIESGFALDDHYVFIRIQPDATVRRAGMVRTSAAFVPLAKLGQVNNLALVFSMLPQGLDTVVSPLKPLDIIDSDLLVKPDSPKSGMRIELARLLLDPDSKLPLVWSSPEPYLPTVAALWTQLPSSLRRSFSFQFLFAPEHHTVMAPTLVVTMPDLANRWTGGTQLNATGTPVSSMSSAHSWLAGSDSSAQFETVLRNFSIELPNFSQLSLISSFTDLVSRIDALTFVEARKAVNIAAKYSKKTAESRAPRLTLFTRLCTLAETCTPEELALLRNLEEASLPDLIPSLQEAIAVSITRAESRDEAYSALFKLAIADKSGWWSVPVVEWLSTSLKILDASGVGKLIWFAASPGILEIATEKLQTNSETEARIIASLPKKLAVTAAENLAAFAVKRKWVALHAECLARSISAQEAIVRHLGVAGTSVAGLVRLEITCGLKPLVEVACETGAPLLTGFIGKLIAGDLDANLPTLPTESQHGLRVMTEVVEATQGPIEGELRKRVLSILNNSQSLDATAAEFTVVCLGRAPSLIIDLISPGDLINRLPEELQQKVETPIENWLRDELQDGQTFSGSRFQGLTAWVKNRSVLLSFSQLPTANAVRGGVSAFRSFDFLNDADCRGWLIDLFTRSQHDPLDSESAKSLADFLGSVDFPESATIVRDTAVEYQRVDVSAVHESIRYKYQMARAYSHNPKVVSTRLPKILIVTALQLERSEIIAFLPNATYDANLQADVAQWPEQNPIYEVYVVASGAGNLEVAAACHHVLKSGLKPKLALFSGVCGGVKDSDVGDVVFSTKVYYTEGGKEEDDGVKARPSTRETDKALVQLAIRVSERAWQPVNNGARRPKATPAVIAASEQVLASTLPTAENFQRLKKNYNDTQVVDMEAYGFLKAVQESGIKLSMVLRGVSDKIAKKEESDAQGNQPLAARNVAAFLFSLLESCQPLLEPKKPKKKGS